jgi:hypothetical protein
MTIARCTGDWLGVSATELEQLSPKEYLTCAGNVVIAASARRRSASCRGRNTISLNIEACRNALADAGIEKDAVDALVVKPPTSNPQFMYGQTLAEAMGLQPRVGGSWDQGVPRIFR